VGEQHAAPGAVTPRDSKGSTSPRAEHTPVLLARCLELLGPALDRDNAVYVDATLGLGGHAEAVLEAHPRVHAIGLDRDPHALAHCERRLARFGDRIKLIHAVYDELPNVLDHFGPSTVDGVLFDLGVSSMQLDQPERGFAYAQDVPLDMRMDPTTPITAEDVVNDYAPGELVRVLRVYGEEKFATRVVGAIVRARARVRITSSAKLADLVREAIPAATRRTGGHPAKRTFQALRIEVNRELAALEAALPRALDALSLGGRVVVLAYHSLEDRMVKRAFAERARSSAPVDLPVELPGTGPSLRLLTRGAELPSEAEVADNPRAASVRLRAAERIDPEGRDATAAQKPAMHRRPAAQAGPAAQQPGAWGRSSRRRDDRGHPGSQTTRTSGAERPGGTDASRSGGTEDADKGEGR
jgi:16S rRNA (cytosine1402-N4)-methyltransferase